MADKKPHPVPPEHPYYPRSPYNRWWNDTEPAYSVAPWEGCCDKEDDCVCVTPDDVAVWNSISSLSGLTAIDWENISSYSAIAASADLWNDDYLTTSANSANWNKVSGLNDLTNLLSSNSANWDSTYKTVSSNSANWNSAVNYSGNINANTSAISALSAAFAKQVKIYFDPNTINGDGTTGAPYTVKNYEDFIALLNKAYSGYKELYTEDGKQNWMSLTATTDSDGTNPYLKTLFNAINKKDNDQDITLNNHGDLIQWILKNLNPPPPISGTDLTWVKINPPTTSGQLTNYNEPNRMYYSVNENYIG